MELQIQSMCASSESLLSLLFTSTANGKSAQNMYNLKLSIKSNYRRFQTTRRRNTRRERTKRENERTEQHEKKFASTAEKKKNSWFSCIFSIVAWMRAVSFTAQCMQEIVLQQATVNRESISDIHAAAMLHRRQAMPLLHNLIDSNEPAACHCRLVVSPYTNIILSCHCVSMLCVFFIYIYIYTYYTYHIYNDMNMMCTKRTCEEPIHSC